MRRDTLELLIRLISSIGAGVTLVGFAVSLKEPLPPWAWICIALLLIGIALVVIFDIHATIRARGRAFEQNSPAIADYLVGWLRSGGRAAILSRDMSWAQDNPAVEPLLTAKASMGELVLCVARETPFIAKLREAGADVHVYVSAGWVPQSRFTIINHGRADAKVAVGSLVGAKHVIQEFSAGSHPYFSVANDLFELVRRL